MCTSFFSLFQYAVCYSSRRRPFSNRSKNNVLFPIEWHTHGVSFVWHSFVCAERERASWWVEEHAFQTAYIKISSEPLHAKSAVVSSYTPSLPQMQWPLIKLICWLRDTQERKGIPLSLSGNRIVMAWVHGQRSCIISIRKEPNIFFFFFDADNLTSRLGEKKRGEKKGSNPPMHISVGVRWLSSLFNTPTKM